MKPVYKRWIFHWLFSFDMVFHPHPFSLSISQCFFSAEHSRASDCPTRTHPTSCPLAHRNRQEQSGDDHPKVVESKQCLKATLNFTGEYPVNLC